MQPFEAILIIFIGLTIIFERRSAHQRQALILARLQSSTRIRMQPEVSNAWNERRIIRRRLQAYGSK